jgi:assimilatory nitrate reductase catalytic subunit
MFYFRSGSTVAGMVNVSIMRDGKLMRYFPVAPNSATHVSLAIVEELPAGTRIDVLAAAEGSGSLILDIGYLEL